MEAIYIYPDGEVYDHAPSWKSDDYVMLNEDTTLGEIFELPLDVQQLFLEEFKQMLE